MPARRKNTGKRNKKKVRSPPDSESMDFNLVDGRNEILLPNDAMEAKHELEKNSHLYLVKEQESSSHPDNVTYTPLQEFVSRVPKVSVIGRFVGIKNNLFRLNFDEEKNHFVRDHSVPSGDDLAASGLVLEKFGEKHLLIFDCTKIGHFPPKNESAAFSNLLFYIERDLLRSDYCIEVKQKGQTVKYQDTQSLTYELRTVTKPVVWLITAKDGDYNYCFMYSPDTGVFGLVERPPDPNNQVLHKWFQTVTNTTSFRQEVKKKGSNCGQPPFIHKVTHKTVVFIDARLTLQSCRNAEEAEDYLYENVHHLFTRVPSQKKGEVQFSSLMHLLTGESRVVVLVGSNRTTGKGPTGNSKDYMPPPRYYYLRFNSGTQRYEEQSEPTVTSWYSVKVGEDGKLSLAGKEEPTTLEFFLVVDGRDMLQSSPEAAAEALARDGSYHVEGPDGVLPLIESLQSGAGEKKQVAWVAGLVDGSRSDIFYLQFDTGTETFLRVDPSEVKAREVVIDGTGRIAINGKAVQQFLAAEPPVSAEAKKAYLDDNPVRFQDQVKELCKFGRDSTRALQAANKKVRASDGLFATKVQLCRALGCRAEIPTQFLCHGSGKVMRDPYTTVSGLSYDLTNLPEDLKQGAVPNTNLRKLIEAHGADLLPDGSAEEDVGGQQQIDRYAEVASLADSRSSVGRRFGERVKAHCTSFGGHHTETLRSMVEQFMVEPERSELVQRMTRPQLCEYLGSRSDSPSVMRIPKEYVCPMTQRILENPVILPGGQSVERDALRAYVEHPDTRGTDPFTLEKLPAGYQQFVPNRSLQQLIAVFTEDYADDLALLREERFRTRLQKLCAFGKNTVPQLRALLRQVIDNDKSLSESEKDNQLKDIPFMTKARLCHELGLHADVPPQFRCEHSKQIMADPVTTISGRTYERRNVPQEDKKRAVPNLNLKRAIEEFGAGPMAFEDDKTTELQKILLPVRSLRRSAQLARSGQPAVQRFQKTVEDHCLRLGGHSVAELRQLVRKLPWLPGYPKWQQRVADMGRQELCRLLGTDAALPKSTVVPAVFRCPFTLTLMTDPVLLPSGVSVERTALEERRRLHPPTIADPVTNEPLPARFEVVPNTSLRALIQKFEEHHADDLVLLAESEFREKVTELCTFGQSTVPQLRTLLWQVLEAENKQNPAKKVRYTRAEVENMKKAQLCWELGLRIQVPDEFRCHATGRVMVDPVVAPNGWTYDRENAPAGSELLPNVNLELAMAEFGLKQVVDRQEAVPRSLSEAARLWLASKKSPGAAGRYRELVAERCRDRLGRYSTEQLRHMVERAMRFRVVASGKIKSEEALDARLPPARVLKNMRRQDLCEWLGRNDSVAPPVRIPDAYLCPLSLTVMQDPVVLPNGLSVERRALELHLAQFPGTDPITNEELKGYRWVRNHSLARLARAFVAEHAEELVHLGAKEAAQKSELDSEIAGELCKHLFGPNTLPQLRAMLQKLVLADGSTTSKEQQVELAAKIGKMNKMELCQELGHSVPVLQPLLCLRTGFIMSDPWTLPDGSTYNRDKLPEKEASSAVKNLNLMNFIQRFIGRVEKEEEDEKKQPRSRDGVEEKKQPPPRDGEGVEEKKQPLLKGMLWQTLKLGQARADAARSAGGDPVERFWERVAEHCGKFSKDRVTALRGMVKELVQLRARQRKDFATPIPLDERLEAVDKMDKKALCRFLGTTKVVSYMSIPEEFLCPVRLEMFKDPVILPGGQTIEREAFQDHARRSNIDPMNRGEIYDVAPNGHKTMKSEYQNLRPNKNLAVLISAFQAAHPTDELEP